MPNTGKPSPSCALCRKRRVKCDLTRPACLRCTKFGAPCPGYRKQLDPDPHSLHFRYYDGSNTYASFSPAVTLDPKNSRLESWANPTYSTMPSQSSFFHIFDINPPLSSQYSPLLLHLYSCSSQSDNSLDSRAFFHDLLQDSSENEPFLVVSRVFAHTYLSQTAKAIPLDSKELGEMYGQSIVAIQSSIRDANGLSDAVMAAVWLMGQYELLVDAVSNADSSGVSPVSGRWHVHTEGLISILKARSPNRFSSEKEMRFFWSMFSQAICRYIIACISFPPLFFEWINEIESQHNVKHAQLIARFHYLAMFNFLTVKVMQILRSGTPDEARDFLPYLVKEMGEAVNILDGVMRSNLDTFADQMRSNPILIAFWAHCQGSQLRLQHSTILLCNFADQGLSNGGGDASEANVLRLQHTNHIRRASFRGLRNVAQGLNHTISTGLGENSDSDEGSDSLDQAQPRLPPWTVVMRCLYPLICASQFRTIPTPVQERTRTLLQTLATDLRIQQALRARRINDPWKMPVSAEWTLGCED